MYKWVIFDMDWLLIDSEPFWEIAERKAFSKVWIFLDSTMVLQTTWLKVVEVVDYWFTKFPWDITIFSKEKVCQIIIDEVILLIKQNWEWKKGVDYIFSYFKEKGFKIAINSSSDYKLIEVVIKKLWIKKFIDVIHSWEEEVFWKPHPAWYISTCQKLKVLPNECIAFEDSLNWIISVKSAKIKCIAIPEKHNFNNTKFIIADNILHSLIEFDDEILKNL